MIRLWLLLIAVAASMDAPALAQAPATVTLDATIVDAKGQPVTGLGTDALRVIVDDKPRPVSAIEFISASAPDVPRTIYLVVDQASVFPGAERALVDVVSGVIDRLGPNDWVGLVALPEPGPRVAPVADTSEVEQALAKLTGRRSPELANFGMGVGEALAIAEGDSFALTAVADRECRGFGSAPNARDSPVAAGGPAIVNPRAECIRRLSRNVELMVAQARRGSLPVFQGLLDLMTSLRDSAGSKAVVLVTGGLAVARGDDAFDELAIRAAAANASVHALLVEPSGGAGSQRLLPVNPANERRSLDRRLDELTGVARGSAQVTSAGTPDVLDRLMGELSGFYRLTVATEPGDSAVPAAGRARGRSGRLRVEAVGRNVTVRTRPFLVAPTGRARAPRTPEERLADALRGGAGMRRELPLETSGSLLFGAGTTVTLLVAGYVELPGTTIDEGPPVISLSYALFDERQQPVATGALPPAAEASGTPMRVTFTGGLDGLEPGRYTLRVAATDAAGRVGSAERILQLRPTRAGNLTASDLLIGRLAANGQVLPTPDVVAPDDWLGLQLDLAGSGVAGAAVRFLVLDRGGSAPVLTLPGTMDVQRPAGATATPMASATAVIGPRLLPAGEYRPAGRGPGRRYGRGSRDSLDHRSGGHGGGRRGAGRQRGAHRSGLGAGPAVCARRDAIPRAARAGARPALGGGDRAPRAGRDRGGACRNARGGRRGVAARECAGVGVPDGGGAPGDPGPGAGGPGVPRGAAGLVRLLPGRGVSRGVLCGRWQGPRGGGRVADRAHR